MALSEQQHRTIPFPRNMVGSALAFAFGRDISPEPWSRANGAGAGSHLCDCCRCWQGLQVVVHRQLERRDPFGFSHFPRRLFHEAAWLANSSMRVACGSGNLTSPRANSELIGRTWRHLANAALMRHSKWLIDRERPGRPRCRHLAREAPSGNKNNNGSLS